MSIHKIEVRPKRNEEGAFQVTIFGKGYPKSPLKFFRGDRDIPGEKTRPAKWRRFDGRTYKTICEYIEKAHNSGKKEVWESPLYRGAKSNQKFSAKRGGC